MAGLRSSLGNFVSGDQFFNRHQEMGELLSRMKTGQHVLMVAPRRMGKTSLTKEFSNRYGKEFVCLYADLQGCATPAEALAKLSIAAHPHQKLLLRFREGMAKVLARTGQMIDSVSISEVEVSLREIFAINDWREKGAELFEGLAKSEKPVVIFWDELPVMIARVLGLLEGKETPEKSEAERFLSWLREMRQRQQGKIIHVLTGSIGIEPILSRIGQSGTINDLSSLRLKVWPPETATAFLMEISRNEEIRLDQPVAELMTNLLGYLLPFHLQIFYRHAADRCLREGTKEITESIARKSFEEDLLELAGHPELAHLEERMRVSMPENEFVFAVDSLTEAAVTGSLTPTAIRKMSTAYAGTLAQQDILRVISILTHDEYLKATPAGLAFISPLLKKWWERRYGLLHIPVSDRP